MANLAKEFDSVRRVFDVAIHGELLGESLFVHRLWAYTPPGLEVDQISRVVSFGTVELFVVFVVLIKQTNKQ